MAADIAMNDMDIDFDMSTEADPEIARLQAEANAIHAQNDVNGEVMDDVEQDKEEGEVDSSSLAPTKVHVRGVRNLNTLDLQAWAGEHYSMDLFKKVQWIDDSSANLIYDTEVAAAEALIAFSAEEVEDPLQLRQARGLYTHPAEELQVRQAILADVKAPGAKDRSQFYLFNKAWDPDNPDNIRPDRRKRRRDDDGHGQSKYRRRDYQDERYHRRGSADNEEFHEDMYGDDGLGSDKSRRNSQSFEPRRARTRTRTSGDLFPDKQNGRLRDRSASPGRDGDGRYGFSEVQPARRTARARTPPRGIRAGRDNTGARENLRKELFPVKKESSALTNGHSNGAARELFSSRPPSSSATVELFPDKSNGAIHRRRQAQDIHPDEVADAIGKYNLDGADDTFAYDESGVRPAHSPRAERKANGVGGKDLFSRIDGGPKIVSDFGRLNSRASTTTTAKADTSFNFKGAGAEFSILGASRERVENPLVKELFPMKAGSGGGGGGGGKDLFDGRIKGRAGRRRAEDMF